MKKFLGFLLVLPFVGWLCAVSWWSYAIERDCIGYLKRAADANTVPLARGELEKALAYITSHGITNGSTAILFSKPSKDVGFWYANLSASYKELQSLPETASPLEKSNMLIKLRETLLDHQSNGVTVTAPGCISWAPHNVAICLIGWLSFFVAVIGFFVFVWGLNTD